MPAQASCSGTVPGRHGMWIAQELDAEWLPPAAAGTAGEEWPQWPGENERPGSCGAGAGFAAGGLLSRLAPGAVLAGFAQNAWADGLDALPDDALIGVLRAWRRLASWATAGELAVVTELDRRRKAEVAAGADPQLAGHVGDELAVSLTLTTRSADALIDLACGLARLPLTRAALASGQIDRAKALVITEAVSGLTDAHAAAVESAVIGRAPGQTSGQLRAATRRAVLAVDPAAADRRREEARKDARVEVWDEHAGTAALAGRDLPPAEVLAADRRIDALARHLKSAGREETLSELRAEVYLALLLGDPVAGDVAAAPSGPEAAQAGPANDPDPSSGGGPGIGSGRPALTGSVNLTMPLATWLGESAEPGEAAGFGPLPADDARALADLISRQPGARWCLTLTSRDGRAIGHGCARAGPDPGSADDWALTVTIRSLAAGDCSHERESRGYRPAASLRHAVNIRQRTCGFPGCRSPAARCDQDHTVPHGQGGRTCECNLAALCRRHHQAKQAQGWWLDQPEPGVLVWRLPHGESYRVEPGRYPIPDS